MRKRIDLTGQRFGRLLVLGFSHVGNSKNSFWYVRCDCCTEKTVAGSEMKRGNTKSCGCLQKELTVVRSKKHGMTKTLTYTIWVGMKQRCYNKNSPKYKSYGNRGITVCDRWLNSFDNFYEDMGGKPEGKSIDRINNNKGYFPGNCRWSSPTEQTNNMRNNIIIKYNNISMTLPQWGRVLNMKQKTLRTRIERLKWPVEKAFLQPVKGGGID